ncbi:MAG: hypothetical protein PVI99_08375 [Anaerolineales bacterium]|jgi:hypothetical protein
MSPALLILYTATFFISLWLGFYLLARDLRKRPLVLTGYGLGFYAAAILAEVIQAYSPPELMPYFSKAHTIFIFMPALIWTGGLLSLIPETFEHKPRLEKTWQWAVFPTTLGAVILNVIISLPPWLLAAIVSLPLAAAFILLLVQHRKRADSPPLGLPLLATVFFGLAVALLLPSSWLPRGWVLLSVGVDLILLGFGIAIFDAFDEGHRLKADMLRSFMSALFLALLFSIQIALAVTLDSGLSFAMVVLLYSTLSTVTAIATLSNLVLSVFNRLGIFNKRQGWEHAQLRAAASVLNRIDPDTNFSRMRPEDLQRLTRKAISYLGDLPRLTSSPLTYLPIVTRRLEQRGERLDQLERAHELKALLTESIQRLKPPEDGRFGTTDAWRYYNALYFPYVVGLKPYRRYQSTETLSEEEKLALEWFRTQVPERTLYNWQTAAAKMVAQDISDRLQGTGF